MIVTATKATKAVICPGHAVFLGGDPTLDASWALQSFQAGESRFYLQHIQRAIEITAADPSTLLIFSGGQTRAQAGCRSEAHSYLEAAEAMHWSAPATLEEFARDSFENLLFGICRFREYTGSYPVHVTIAGWAFKQARYEWHRATIGWPAEQFSYLGVNQPPDLARALAGEQHALAEFQRDPLGTHGSLQAKRIERNPFAQQPPYWRTCPEMAPFLDTIRFTTETAI